MLTLQAPAKINLALEVINQRPDNYHNICTIFQTINLCDILSFQKDKGLFLSVPGRYELERDDNDVLKAARLLQEVSGCNKGAFISLSKSIPEAAGMSGHSTDAAATLIGLNQLWELNLPLLELVQIACRLSSDTAFFLYGGTALGEELGNRITPLPDLPEYQVILLKPKLSKLPKKTEKLYAMLSDTDYTDGKITYNIAKLIHKGEDITSSLFNGFETVAAGVFNELDNCRQHFLAAGASSVHITGAGPTLFTLEKDRDKAEQIYNRIKRPDLDCYIVSTLKRTNITGWPI